MVGTCIDHRWSFAKFEQQKPSSSIFPSKPSKAQRHPSLWEQVACGRAERFKTTAGSPGWKRSLSAKLGKTVKKTAERCAIANVVGTTAVRNPLEASTLGAVFKLEGSRRAPGVRNFWVDHSFEHPACATYLWAILSRTRRAQHFGGPL